MASVPFVIERRVHYHGIWNAGYNIGELFFRNISREFVHKPPYPAVLRLSSNTMSLSVFRRGSSQSAPLRTDAIPFEALRDITANPFNTRCLLVIYVNNKNKFSVLVSSCRSSAETRDITSAFQKLRAMRQANVAKVSQNNNSNWIMRRNSSINDNKNIDNNNDDDDDNNNVYAKVDETDAAKTNGLATPLIIINNNDNNSDNGKDDSDNGDASANGNLSPSIKSRTDSRVLAENFEFLDQHDDSFDDMAVFEDDTDGFIQEEGPGDNSSSVGLQTNIQDRSDRLSVSSNSSFASLQDLKDEIDSISLETQISQEEYLKSQTHSHTDSDSGLANGVTQTQDEVDGDSNDDGPQTNGLSDTDSSSLQMILVERTEDYDFRSVGTQTETVSGVARKRYTKRPGSMGTSNMYKALAEQRKHKNSLTNESNGVFPYHNGVVAKQRPVSYHVTNGVRGGRVHSVYVTRPVSVKVGSTTVARPIEHVYHSHTWSRRGLGHSRKRRVLVMNAGRHTVRI